MPPINAAIHNPIPVADLVSGVDASKYLAARRNLDSVGPGWQALITRTVAPRDNDLVLLEPV